MEFTFSTALLLFLVIDPFGNIPFFIEELRVVPPERYAKVLLREALIALCALVVFLLGGGHIIRLLQVSHGSLGIAGGVILFLIALKMVFGVAQAGKKHGKEPFIVPLAIPMIAGPSALATVVLVSSKPEATLPQSLIALLVAWLASTVILFFSKPLSRLLGEKAMDASESLMGLLLTAIAVEMLINGIKASFF